MSDIESDVSLSDMELTAEELAEAEKSMAARRAEKQTQGDIVIDLDLNIIAKIKHAAPFDPNIFFSLTCACAKIVIWNQWGYRLVNKYIPHLPIPYGGYIILQRGDSLTTLCELSRRAPLIGSTFLTSDILVLPRFCPNLDAQEVFLEQHKVWKKLCITVLSMKQCCVLLAPF